MSSAATVGRVPIVDNHDNGIGNAMKRKSNNCHNQQAGYEIFVTLLVIVMVFLALMIVVMLGLRRLEKLRMTTTTGQQQQQQQQQKNSMSANVGGNVSGRSGGGGGGDDDDDNTNARFTGSRKNLHFDNRVDDTDDNHNDDDDDDYDRMATTVMTTSMPATIATTIATATALKHQMPNIDIDLQTAVRAYRDFQLKKYAIVGDNGAPTSIANNNQRGVAIDSTTSKTIHDEDNESALLMPSSSTKKQQQQQQHINTLMDIENESSIGYDRTNYRRHVARSVAKKSTNVQQQTLPYFDTLIYYDAIFERSFDLSSTTSRHFRSQRRRCQSRPPLFTHRIKNTYNSYDLAQITNVISPSTTINTTTTTAALSTIEDNVDDDEIHLQRATANEFDRVGIKRIQRFYECYVDEDNDDGDGGGSDENDDDVDYGDGGGGGADNDKNDNKYNNVNDESSNDNDNYGQYVGYGKRANRKQPYDESIVCRKKFHYRRKLNGTDDDAITMVPALTDKYDNIYVHLLDENATRRTANHLSINLEKFTLIERNGAIISIVDNIRGENCQKITLVALKRHIDNRDFWYCQYSQIFANTYSAPEAWRNLLKLVKFMKVNFLNINNDSDDDDEEEKEEKKKKGKVDNDDDDDNNRIVDETQKIDNFLLCGTLNLHDAEWWLLERAFGSEATRQRLIICDFHENVTSTNNERGLAGHYLFVCSRSLYNRVEWWCEAPPPLSLCTRHHRRHCWCGNLVLRVNCYIRHRESGAYVHARNHRAASYRARQMGKLYRDKRKNRDNDNDNEDNVNGDDDDDDDDDDNNKRRRQIVTAGLNLLASDELRARRQRLRSTTTASTAHYRRLEPLIIVDRGVYERHRHVTVKRSDLRQQQQQQQQQPQQQQRRSRSRSRKKMNDTANVKFSSKRPQAYSPPPPYQPTAPPLELFDASSSSSSSSSSISVASSSNVSTSAELTWSYDY